VIEAATPAIAVRVADPALARALEVAIAGAIAGAADELGEAIADAERAPVVRLRARKAVARDRDRLAGAIAVVPVTVRNARHLVALIEAIRAAGAIGVQLAWDGTSPPHVDVERHVFAALERARATRGEPPVVLAASEAPVPALHIVIAHRLRARREPR
jgi:hypothetical protein